MDINTAAGEKVVFIGMNGYESELTSALRLLKVGEVLTVEHIEVSQSSSAVIFKELSGLRFNTVMFKNATSTWERFHWFAYCYIGIPELTQEDFASMPFDEDHMSDEVRAALPVAEVVYQCVISDVTPKAGDNDVKNVILTLSRGVGMELGFINPASEEAAQEVFVARFGHNATISHFLYCGATFDPTHVSRYSKFCDC